MTKKFNWGGPAFPTILEETTEHNKENDKITLNHIKEHPGMSLWDYYAAAALRNNAHEFVDSSFIAKCAALIADDMLEEREKRFKKE